MLTVLHSAQVLSALAVLMVLRDMGNGVVRLECARLLERFNPRRDPDPGFHPMIFPPSPMVADCLDIARRSVGVCPGHEFTAGRCRPVTDEVMEYCIW